MPRRAQHHHPTAGPKPLAGTNANFTVVATGQATLFYQWSLNGTNSQQATHQRATNATLVISTSWPVTRAIIRSWSAQPRHRDQFQCDADGAAATSITDQPVAQPSCSTATPPLPRRFRHRRR